MNEVLIAGKCPFCSGPLAFNGSYIYCGNGHYRADPIAFDDLWKKYIEIPDASLEDSEKLLLDLQALHDQPIPTRTGAFSRPGCLFLACPCPSLCQATCQHKD